MPERKAQAPAMSAPEPVRIRRMEGPHFALPLPEEWVDRSIYCAGGPLVNGFQSSVTVAVEARPQLKDLLEYVRIQKSQLEGQLTDFAAAPGSPQPVAEGAAYRLEFTWTTPEKVPISQQQWYVYRAPLVWVITASAHRQAPSDVTTSLGQVCRQIVFK